MNYIKDISKFKILDVSVYFNKNIEFFRDIIDLGFEISPERSPISMWVTILSDLFEFRFSWSKNEDHAGVSFYLGILWFTLNIMYYDTRHWDYDKEEYMKY